MHQHLGQSQCLADPVGSVPGPAHVAVGPRSGSGATIRRKARRSIGAAVGVAVLITICMTGLSAAGAAASQDAASHAGTASTVLAEDILPGLPLLAPSRADSSTLLRIGIGLEEPNQSAEMAYEQGLYDPSSADYHEFLTPAEFASQYGVARGTVEAVQDWLISGGLAVTETAAAGNWLQAVGTIGQIESLMHITIGRYESKGVRFLANEEAPTVPAGDSILTVVGLNTLQQFSIPKEIVGQPTTPTSPGCLPSCDYTPQDLWSLYSMPRTDEGQGMTMAVIGEGRTNDVISNLRAFESAMKLPRVPITVHDVGAGPFTDDSGQVEWDLDTQASTGMAPKVLGETLYFAASLADADVETAFSAWVSDPNGPLEANASFGECETDPGNEVWNAAPPAVGQYAGDGDNLEPVAEATLEQATL
jgi:pseudomonalisin